MTCTLIPTMVGDVHAAAVSLGLERLGHKAVRWFGADFPTRQLLTFGIDRDTPPIWSVEGMDLSISASARFDRLWHRRPTKPVLPVAMHPGDRLVAEDEGRAFFDWLWYVVAPGAFRVNPRVSIERAQSKALQLRLAREVGLAIPPTLITNDPARIRQFIDANRATGTVYKRLSTVGWRGESGQFETYATVIDAESLPDDDVLRLAPGIFQRRIPRDHEVRITFFGDFAVAVRIAGDSYPNDEVDWRGRGVEDHALSPASVPEPLLARCRRLMRDLGIVFGCFDFIVTEAGEHVFLEVNETGQFLWVEQGCPDIPMLAYFCHFLLGGTRAFDGGADALRLPLARLSEDGTLAKILEEDRRCHVEYKRLQAQE